MRTDPAEPLRQARRLDSEHKRTLVLAAADAQLEAGRHPSIASIARQAGVGRKFIYDHPDLKACIELKAAQATRSHAGDLVAAARVTGASLRAELENARAQNHRLTRQLRALENRLSKAEGAHLVADELLPDGVLTELADQQLASRVMELDQQLFEAKEGLRRTTEELEAARSINRELMQQANRPQP
jgi:chromosome segregation ATPase